MTALDRGRNTPQRDHRYIERGVAASKKIFEGALVCLSATGYLTPGATATGLIAVGRAVHEADNAGGSDGDIDARIESGVFRWANSADSDLITAAEIGDTCYVVDDQTVAKTSGSSTRSPAGIVVDVDAQGVWVRSGAEGLAAPAGALVAANNLSDVGTAGTARANIGANLVALAAPELAKLDDDTHVVRVVSPVAGTLARIWSVIDGALTTGNATLTAKIDGDAVTSGVVTITQAGSAAGDVDNATPSGANTVAVGDIISFEVGGTNDAARTAAITLLIET